LEIKIVIPIDPLCYLRQGGRYVIRSVCLSFVLSVQEYCKCNQHMVEPTNRKSWLTFHGDPVADTDSGSLSRFPHRCGIGNLRKFISIFHTITGRFSHDTRRNNWRRQAR